MGFLTAEQTRMLRDYSPNLGNRPPGIDLAQLLEDLSGAVPYQLDLSAGAEGAGAANAIDIDLKLQDWTGQTVAAAHKFYAEVIDHDTGVAAAATEFTLNEVGDGAEVSTGGKPGLIFQTANGVAKLRVTDVGGAANRSVTVLIRPVDVHCRAEAVTLTFDAS